MFQPNNFESIGYIGANSFTNNIENVTYKVFLLSDEINQPKDIILHATHIRQGHNVTFWFVWFKIHFTDFPTRHHRRQQLSEEFEISFSHPQQIQIQRYLLYLHLYLQFLFIYSVFSVKSACKEEVSRADDKLFWVVSDFSSSGMSLIIDTSPECDELDEMSRGQFPVSGLLALN